MTRVLYITPGCFDKGGISRYNRYQIRGLREHFGAANVRVISLHGPAPDSFEEPMHVEWHGSAYSLGDKVRFVRAILSHIVGWRPHVVLIGHVNFAGLIEVLSRLFGFRTILNVYGIEIWSGLPRFSRWGLEHADRIISDCHNTADYALTHFRVRGRIEVIWDCVDLEKFRHDESRFDEIRERYGLPDRSSSVCVLTLGRISVDARYKGYERLLDVAARVIASGRPVRFIFAGAGDLVESLRSQAQALGIADAVTFAGSVREQDMGALYSYAHIFSLVTESGHGMGEGIPLTPLEAMACRTPIIVGNQDGSREAVMNEENGFVIDPGDLDRHAAIICQWTDFPDERNKAGDGAARLAHRFFAFDAFKEKHAELFRELHLEP